MKIYLIEMVLFMQYVDLVDWEKVYYYYQCLNHQDSTKKKFDNINLFTPKNSFLSVEKNHLKNMKKYLMI